MIVTSSADRNNAVHRLNMMTEIRSLEKESAADSERFRSGRDVFSLALGTVSAPSGESVGDVFGDFGEEAISKSMSEEDVELIESCC